MHIVHLCSELAPIAKVGGLGDVVYGLSKELTRAGHTVDIILPKYDCIDFSQLKKLKVHFRDLWSFDGAQKYNNTIWSAEIENLHVYLIEPHHPSYFFSRGKIYGCEDDIDRFLYFSRTAMEYLFKADVKPDAIHLHDWPTAVASTLYKDMYLPLGFKAGGTVLTIHNLEHQGRCNIHNLFRIGFRGENYLTPDSMQDPSMPNVINLLKGGIETADFISTVSPNYENEIQTAEGGHGLDETLKKHRKKLKGILNGIDEEFWNPQTDHHLVENYNSFPPFSEEKLEKIFNAKEENKRQLRTHLGLTQKDTPLVGCITRLVIQKGPYLIAHAMRRTLEKGGQFVLLGSVFSSDMEKLFLDLKEEFAGSRDLSILLDKNESLAHLIFAGSDLLIIPSLFEPCGLTQMIALRYGTVPIVRSTGGLADTVFDFDAPKIAQNLRNGFVFDFPDANGVNWALDRALDTWNDSLKWIEIMKNGMSQDFSWKHSLHEYVKLYESLGKNLHPSVKEKKKRSKAA